jgi:hypothetical protein
MAGALGGNADISRTIVEFLAPSKGPGGRVQTLGPSDGRGAPVSVVCNVFTIWLSVMKSMAYDKPTMQTDVAALGPRLRLDRVGTDGVVVTSVEVIQG